MCGTCLRALGSETRLSTRFRFPVTAHCSKLMFLLLFLFPPIDSCQVKVGLTVRKDIFLIVSFSFGEEKAVHSLL